MLSEFFNETGTVCFRLLSLFSPILRYISILLSRSVLTICSSTLSADLDAALGEYDFHLKHRMRRHLHFTLDFSSPPNKQNRKLISQGTSLSPSPLQDDRHTMPFQLYHHSQIRIHVRFRAGTNTNTRQLHAQRADADTADIPILHSPSPATT
jgi:hypothetical protein